MPSNGGQASAGQAATEAPAPSAPAPWAAAAAAEPQGPSQQQEAPDAARQLWRQFDRERSCHRSSADRLAGAVFMAVILVARMRVGVMETEVQEAHGLAVLFLTIAVMMAGEELVAGGLGWLRSVLVFALKLSAATCPLFTLVSIGLGDVDTTTGTSDAPSVAFGLLRTAVADHTALLLLLGTCMSQGIVANAVTQLAFFICLSTVSGALCDTKIINAFRTSRHLAFIADQRACVMFMASTQLSIGVVLPMLLSVRRESAAAVKFARANAGIPASDRRLRTYCWLHRATTLGDSLSTKVAAGLVGVYAVWAAAAWSYLGAIDTRAAGLGQDTTAGVGNSVPA